MVFVTSRYLGENPGTLSFPGGFFYSKGKFAEEEKGRSSTVGT